VDMLRQEYGKEPMDFSGYDKQPAAVGQGGAAAPAQAPTATGPNGQKLIYKDGQWQPIQ
jgi:hypothetical protein